MFNKIVFFLILLSIIVRFLGLDQIPPHLSNDEIGAAYDAYSVSKTLRDGHNQFLPISFQSLGIYRSPLAVYLTIPAIVLFGNSDFSARFPSAILATLTIIFIGVLVLELTGNKKLALTSSLMLSFSTWHFAASRWTTQSNYALFFIVLGIYLFYFGLKRKNYLATLASFAIFAISIYTYYTEWGLSPLIIACLLFFNRKIVLKNKIYYLAICLFLILLIPLTVDFFAHLHTSRAASELQLGPGFLKMGLDKYSRYTSLSYIFFNGANLLPKQNPYQAGFFLSPFLISFIFGLSKLKEFFKGHSNFIYSWLLVSPVIPALSLGDLNNLRSLPMVLPYSIVIATGSLYLLDHLRQRFFLKILAITTLSASVLYFILIFTFHFPIQTAESFQYGYKQMAFYIKDHYNEYEKIIIDPRFGSRDYYYSGVPNAYIPYYTYLDPVKVQNAKPLFPVGIAFDKYEFRDIHFEKEKIQPKYLYAVPFDEIPTESQSRILKQVYEIQLPNHKVEFKLYSE